MLNFGQRNFDERNVDETLASFVKAFFCRILISNKLFEGAYVWWLYFEVW